MLLGGILTSGLSWRWVLFVNVPIGIAGGGRSRRGPSSRAARRTQTRSFDIPGAVTVTAGLALLVYAVVDAVNAGWGSTATLLRLAGAAVLLLAFLAIESRQRQPLMPFSIFRLRTLRGANIVGLLIGMSLFSMFFFISLYLQNVLHYSPIKAGLSYLPLVGRDHPVGRRRLAARHAPRLQAAADRRPAADRGRPAVVLPGAGHRRLVRRRRARPVAARRRRPRVSRSSR